MTERFFYRDPLAAAWMAKHFGMQYTEKLKTFGKTDWQDPECYLAGLPRSGKTEWSRCNYYIHHDSYPILESINKVTRAALKLVGLWPEKETIEEGVKYDISA
jgi:hypothetical protein